MKIYKDIEQGSPEWFELRKGKFTGSKLSKLFMGKNTQGYQDMILQCVYERLTGQSPDDLSKTKWMERGNELEDQARFSYMLENECKVDEICFAEFDEWLGVSPDGLVGDKGGVEIKCPKYSTLLNLHLSSKPEIERIHRDYYWQMQGCMYVLDREWWDYYVYDPNFKPFQFRLNRNNTDIEFLKNELEIAKEQVLEKIEIFNKLGDINE